MISNSLPFGPPGSRPPAFLAWLPAPGFVTPPPLIEAWRKELGVGAEHIPTAGPDSGRGLTVDAGAPILLPNPRIIGDGHWVGQVRLDDRRALQAALGSEGGSATGLELMDLELLARAWAAWGSDAGSRLMGDFAWVQWHPETREVWIARDLFGVEPLYFAESEHGVAISNLPSWVMSAPGVGDRLDELGVLDYLLFDGPREPMGTLFRDLRRLPPASLLRWSMDPSARSGWRRDPVNGTTKIHDPRDWQPVPIPAEPEGVAEELVRLLTLAIDDRRPKTGNVAISMSGGLDSVSVAALAGRGSEVSAHTLVYRRLLRDLEGPPATQAAAALGLQHHLFAMDGYRFFDRWRQLPMGPVPGEPMADAIYHDFDIAVLQSADTVLSGWGGDPIFLPESRWWRSSLAEKGWARTLAAGWQAYRLTGRRPPLGFHGAWLRRQETKRLDAQRLDAQRLDAQRLDAHRPSPLPPWLAAGFARRSNARERFVENLLDRPPTAPVAGPRSAESRGSLVSAGLRPGAFHHTFHTAWSHHFERIHGGVRGLGLVRRHPFFDARVARFALSLSTLPWCHEKLALRWALRGRIPEAVRLRPKTPQRGDPRHGWAEPPAELWRTWLAGAPELGDYLDVGAMGDWSGSVAAQKAGHGTPWRPALDFACWLTRWRDRGQDASGRGM